MPAEESGFDPLTAHEQHAAAQARAAKECEGCGMFCSTTRPRSTDVWGNSKDYLCDGCHEERGACRDDSNPREDLLADLRAEVAG